MWIKLFRQRKIQTIMIFLVILLCTTLLNGAVTMLTSMKEPYKELKEESNPSDITVFWYLPDREACSEYINRFEKLESVQKIETINYVYIEDDLYVYNQKLDVFTDFVEYNKDVYGSVRMVQGEHSLLDNLKDNECLVPVCIMNEYNLDVGDVLTIRNATATLNYKIIGSFVEPYSTSTAFDSAILVNEIPSVYTKQQILKAYAKDGFNGEDIEEEYRTAYSGIFPGFIETVDDILENALITTNIVSAIFLAIGCIMLIVSCLIINFMIRHAMKSDAKTIAVYKTMGYTTNDILRMYLYFYACIVAVASALGIYLSKFISMIILKGIFENLGTQSSINVLKSGIPCFILVVGFVELIVYLIIRKTRKIKPVFALNGLSSTNTKKQRYHGKAVNSFSPLGITIRNIIRDKKGVVGILITSIVTVIGVNFGMISLDVAFTQKDNNNYWLGVDPSDVVVNVSQPENYDDVLSYIKSDDRIDHYLNVSQNERILFDWNKENNSPTLSAFVYDDYNSINLPVIKGRNPANKKEIAISTKVSNDLGKEIGDYIECYIGGDYKTEFLITGLFQTYYQLGDACRIRTDAYTSNNLDFNYNTCSIYLKDGVDQENFIKDMKEKIGDFGEVIPRTEAFLSIMNMITEPQIKGIPPVIFLVFLIGSINIFCIVMLKNADNAKSNGIYKCLGYTTIDLIKSNLYYIGIIALISVAVGLPITILTYADIMSVALSIFGFRKYPLDINALHLVIVNTGVILLFVISTLLSSRSLYHVDVRDLVIE